MSVDYSARGMRFCGHREYKEGELLRVSLEEPFSTAWPGSREFRAKVVRVSPRADGVALEVAVCRGT